MKQRMMPPWVVPCLVLLVALCSFATTRLFRRNNVTKPVALSVPEVRHPTPPDPAEFADLLHPYMRRRDVIYSRKAGAALTMDVFTPKKGAKGLALVYPVSAGWISNQSIMDSPFFAFLIDEPVKRGYTVFAVCHSSQPTFTIPDAIADLNQAVRYIRYHAHEFDIAPDRIGVLGASSGGHLALMLGVAGDGGDSRASDPVDRVSSRVQTIACFFAPTDFLNYGEKGKFAFAEDGKLADLRPAIDVRELDKRTKRLEHISDRERIEELCRRVSPITHVSSMAAPTLILHGDADQLVPVQQGEVMVAKLKEAGVSAELMVKKGKKHIWVGMDQDMGTLLEWFDKHLTK